MAVNKYKLRLNRLQDDNLDRDLIIPIQNTTDEVGRGDLVADYEKETLAKLLGLKKDYEVTRYAHAPLIDGDPSPNIFYNFNFGYLLDSTNTGFDVTYRKAPNQTFQFNDATLNPTAPCPDQWEEAYPGPPDGPPMYIPSGIITTGDTGLYGYELQDFTVEETYRNEKSFVKSFFKLDLYDSPIRNEQQLYVSILLNPINGKKLFMPTLNSGCSGNLGGRWNCKPLDEQNSPIPQFELDPFNNNDGYYIYWLKENTFLDLSVFYMSCKFYNGKTGVVTSFLNTPQTSLPTPYSFPTQNYFYYRVELNKNNYTYTMYNATNDRVGATQNTSLNFYEYFNSP